MNFLKKLGVALVNAAGIAAGIGPLVVPFLGSGKAGVVGGAVVNDLTQVAQLVVQAEVMMQGVQGPDRLKAIVPLVTNVVRTSELVSGKKIANEKQFTLGCQEIAQGVYDVLSGIHPDEAKTA